MRQTIFITIYTGKLLNIAVPRSEVFVADGPVNTMPVLSIGLKIKIAPAVALTAPHKRTTTYMVTADPPELFNLVIWILYIVDKELFRNLVVSVTFTLDG